MATKNGNENLDKKNQTILWDYNKITRLKNFNETLSFGSLKVKDQATMEDQAYRVSDLSMNYFL